MHVEALDEGGYRAASDDVQGLIARGESVQESLELARDVARTLLKAQAVRRPVNCLKEMSTAFDCPFNIGLYPKGTYYEHQPFNPGRHPVGAQ